MQTLSLAKVEAYRSNTFHLTDKSRLKTPEDAIQFVNERGFIFFWPVKGVVLPSLWAGVAGDRPVPDDHDDPGHITWGWKDSLLDQHVWYYGRILKHKNAFISHSLLPYFYALSPNYGSPEDDFADDYQTGHLSLETKLIFETLVDKGRLDTINLRKEAHLSGQNSSGPFNRALDQLQMDFRVLPVAIADIGAWHYAFIYDLTHRQYPDLIEESRPISESQARGTIVLTYLRSVGVAREKDVASYFIGMLRSPIGVVESLKRHGEVAGELITRKLKRFMGWNFGNCQYNKRNVICVSLFEVRAKRGILWNSTFPSAFVKNTGSMKRCFPMMAARFFSIFKL